MTRRPLLGSLAGTAALALTVLSAAPALAHGDQQGDLPTNTRAAGVAESGNGEEMSFVANLQYDDSGQAQNGSDVEFLKVGKKEYA